MSETSSLATPAEEVPAPSGLVPKEDAKSMVFWVVGEGRVVDKGNQNRSQGWLKEEGSAGGKSAAESAGMLLHANYRVFRLERDD